VVDRTVDSSSVLVKLPRAFMVQLEHCLVMVIAEGGARYSGQETEVILREPECVLGLLSCMSGDNHCRAHLSESKEMRSVSSPKRSPGCLSFKAEICDRDERVKTMLRGIFLEGSEKYPKRET
jgi:hypothetical protein